MTSNEIIHLARQHVAANAASESSARLCLEDAERLYAAGEFPAARKRALDSLKHSVGIFHEDFSRALGWR